MVELMKELIRLDKHWIPDQPGYSLYIRPTMSASHERSFDRAITRSCS